MQRSQGGSDDVMTNQWGNQRRQFSFGKEA